MTSKKLRARRSASRSIGAHPAPKPTVDEVLANRSRLNKASTDFLKVDLETALTFTSLALQAKDHEKRERNRKAARKAYDTVVHLMGRVTLNEAETSFFKEQLEHLRSNLVELGEVL